MNNILVPLGTSPDAVKTLEYAIDFAAEFGAKVYVMDVFTVSSGAGNLGNLEKKVASKSRDKIKELMATIDTKGLDVNIATYNGDIVDGLSQIDKELDIDLIVIAPRSNDVNEALYLGNTSGRMIKETNIPALIVPKGAVFQPPKSILTAFKSGGLKRNKILHPLISVIDKFKSEINLLLVKTPGYSEQDLKINTALLDLSSEVAITDNQTTYLGVLQHFETKKPDWLCVFRRKRGFFKKLWEKSTVPKSEFYSAVPVLVLSIKDD